MCAARRRRRGRRRRDSTPAGERAATGEISIDAAMRLLAMARGKPAGQANGSGREPWRRRRSLDEVQNSILRKIAAIERHEAAEPVAADGTSPSLGGSPG
jgi:hypothetical protein